MEGLTSAQLQHELDRIVPIEEPDDYFSQLSQEELWKWTEDVFSLEGDLYPEEGEYE